MKLPHLASLLFSAAFVSTSFGALHIDYLSDAGFTLDGLENETSTATQTGDPGNIIGTERNVSLTTFGGASVANLDVPTGPGAVGPSSSLLRVREDAASAGQTLLTLSLLYNGVGDSGLTNSNSILGVDFTTDGATSLNAFAVEMAGVFDGLMDLAVTVFDADSNTGNLVLEGLNSAGIYNVFYNDSNFQNVDFSRITSLQFDFETIEPGVTFDIGGLTAVNTIPEPTSVGFLGLVAFGCLLRRTRA